MREIDIHKQPERFLEFLLKSDKVSLKKILKEIDNICKYPRPVDSRKLVGFKGYYRVRIGKYRIVYKFNEEILSILFIGKRDEIYEMLH